MAERQRTGESVLADLTRRRGFLDRYYDLSMVGKTMVSVGCILALLGAVSTAFFWAGRHTDKLRDAMDLMHRRMAQVSIVENEMLYAQRLLHNAVLQVDPQQIAAYNAQLLRYDEALAQLRLDARSEPTLLERLRRIDQLVAQWQAASAAPTVEALLDDRQREALRSDPDVLRELTLRGVEGINTARSVLQDMAAQDRRILDLRRNDLGRAQQWADAVVLTSLALGCVMVLIWLRLTRAGLGEPLAQLTSLIARISGGETALGIPYQQRRDEVGSFARALFQLREVVAARESANWVKSRLAQLSSALQQCPTHEQFGEALLRDLCDATGAAQSVAYRWDEDRALLVACAGYAVAEEALADLHFRPGQGWPGQSFSEQRALRFDGLPSTGLPRLSGFGAAETLHLLVLPLCARGEVTAVLELAYAVPPDARSETLIREAASVVALSWQTLSRSLRTLDLLRTTSAQAEELRASEEALRVQQEELRSTNETLRDRTQLLEEQRRRLRASEEELRAQAEELRVTNTALTERGEVLRQRQEEIERARQELERRAQDLEQASRYKSEFLANMSHELRTPLNSMLILSRALADNEEQNLTPDQIESARIVHDSGVSLLHLINDILDLSKIEAGKMQLTLEDVELPAFLATQERNFRHVANSRGLSFEIHAQAGLPPKLHTDGTRLGQVLTNLLSNAFKFTQQGGVTLSVGRPNAASTVHMPGLDPQRAVYFAVADTGIGIPQAKLEQVFLPFEQADGGTSRRFGGTGLGLSIVRGMAQLLGGEVQVQSEEGVGSVFMLILPERIEQAVPVASESVAAPSLAQALVAAPPAAAPAHAEPMDGEPGPGSCILIVEDDPVFSGVLAGIATRKGVQTLVAHSGAEALRLARQGQLAGVLLDLGLPDMSGWQVLEALKAEPATRAIPVHIISAKDESSRGLAMGAVGFLVKPATREGVVAALERVAHFGDGRKRRLLLVDDDAGSRAAVRKLLENENLDIVEADHGEGALAALSGLGPFDCVILDLGLPDISGFEWLERASRLGEIPPVVIYSGRELTPEENLRLREYTESIVIKGARSPERLLDEVSLFLHAIQKPAVKPQVAQPGAPAIDVAGKTVLVVDDDMRNVFALSKTLRGRGLKVLMAQDGYKALTQLEANPQIDIVLMDIMMPGMDGYETIRRVRAQPRWARLPIIAVTAKAMKGDREKCLESGASDYCSKPIDIDQLMSQIRVWV